MTAYKEELGRKMRKIERQNDQSTEYNITQGIKKLYNGIKAAEAKAIPKKKVRKNNRCRQKWSEELKEAVKQSKIAHKEWKKAGAPTNVDNPHYLRRKCAKRALRSVQRQQEARRRAKLYNDITQADGKDQKVFFKLVNEQRNTKAAATKEIVVEEI